MESITKTSLARETLNAIARERLGAELVDATELTDGWFNTAYRLDLADGRTVALKVAPGDDIAVMRYERDILRSEIQVMAMVRERTQIPIPTVLAYDTTRELIPHDFYVMEWLPGKMMNRALENMDPADIASAKRQIGQILRTVNDIPGESFGMVAGPRFGSWRAAVEGLFEDLIADGLASPVALDYEAIRATVRRHGACFDTVTEPRMVHWDLWEGNVAVLGGQVTGVIDFERTLWGDPLMETNWMGASPEFVEGYGTDLRLEPDAATRRKLYDLYLYTIMQIEAWYRQFSDLRAVNWAEEEYAKLMAELTCEK